MDAPENLLGLIAYGALGLTLSCVYRLCPGPRESNVVQWTTLLASFVAAWSVLASSGEGSQLGPYHLGIHSLLFFAMSLCYLPVLVFILLHQWNRLLLYLTSPGKTVKDPVRRPLTASDEWALIRSCLEKLRENPLNVARREQLAMAYSRLGFVDSAVGEYRKAIECQEKGYAQGLLLFKACRLLVDRKNDIPAALPMLRRILRLYPRSYFAAYARRIVNHYEARHPGIKPSRLRPPRQD